MEVNRPIIAILGGTGREGTGLAIRWAAAGYAIIIGSRKLDRARMSADEINKKLGITSVIGMENHEAIKNASICVLTVVQDAHQQVLKDLKDDLQEKILVDATSRVDYRNPLPPVPPSAAQQAQEQLGSNVRVVAAFQNVPAKSLATSPGVALEADALICSDDIDAAEQVIKLAFAAGMRAYYAGKLANSIVVEGLTAILLSMNKHYGIKDSSIMITGVRNQPG
jgi:hypothetical protein